MQTIEQWLKEMESVCGFTANVLPFDGNDQENNENIPFALRTVTGKYWEVPRPMIQPKGADGESYGAGVLLYKIVDGELYILVQAKAEPGSLKPGCLTVSATIINSYKNIRAYRFENKEKTGVAPYSQYITEDMYDSMAHFIQDPGMLYHKVLDYHSRDVSELAQIEQDLIEPLQRYRWMSLNDIKIVIQKGYVTQMFAEALSVCLLAQKGIIL